MNFRLPTPVFQAPDTSSSAAPAAPSSTPSAAPTPTPSSTSSGQPDPSSPTLTPSDGVDPSSALDFMFNPVETDPFEGPGLPPPATVTPAMTPSQPAPAQPATPAATAPEPAKPDVVTAAPAPTEPTSPAAAVAPQANLDPYDPGTLAAHLAQNEEQVVQHVADSLFKLSDKDVEALESDTVGTIPKLLARSFVAAQRNFLMQMAQIVPRMVQVHGEVTKRHSEAENEFYTRWPDIKKDQHGKLVMQYAAVYRQMHPEASRKDMIDALGPMVMMAAKIVPSAARPHVATPSPMTNGAGRPPQPAPFVPAGPTGAGALPSTAPQLSPIEAMFAENQNEA